MTAGAVKFGGEDGDDRDDVFAKLRVVRLGGDVVKNSNLDAQFTADKEDDLRAEPQQPISVSEDEFSDRARQQGLDQPGQASLLTFKSTAGVGYNRSVLGVVPDGLRLPR